MSKSQVILNSEDRVRFMLAGKAWLMLRSRKTGTELRYAIMRSKKYSASPRRYVYAKIADKWVYIGVIHSNRPTKPFYFQNNRNVSSGNLVVKGFTWLWYKLVRNEEQDSIDVLHIGRCGRCGRKLTDTKSMRRGLGPKCYSIVTNK